MKRNTGIITMITTVLLMTGCTGGEKSPEEPMDMRGGSVMYLALDKTPEAQPEGYEPLNYDTVRGIWMSYIDLAPMLSAETGEEFAGRFDKACRDILSLGCNTVYVHVRPFGDAAYRSELYPASAYLGGDYDPLEIMCDTAHGYGLSLHAWINPLRLQTPGELEQISLGYDPARWYAEDTGCVRQVEGDIHLWLDPSYPQVRRLIAQGCGEIVRSYPVDGIHYDDYFYPTTSPLFDREQYREYSGDLSLEDWRMNNITELCREIYTTVKAENPGVQVGISPQGNIENNYQYMYADVKLWCREEGICDYILPQLYYAPDDPVKPFSETLDTWRGLTEKGSVKLLAGLGAYKIGREQSFTDTPGIIASQAQEAFDKGLSGTALYTYGSFFDEEGYVSERMALEGEELSEVRG